MHSDARIDALRARVRDVPDFPKPGILFKDLTPVMGDAALMQSVGQLLAERVEQLRPELIVGIESRGFIFGAPLAAQLGVGFAPVRKPGKLPWRRLRETYTLESGTDALELHEDAVAGRRVLVVDDLLATGGTASATGRLVERAGGTLAGYAFVVELSFLPGRSKLGSAPAEALVVY